MLLDAMGVKAVNPEHRVIDAIANAVGAVILRHLHDAAHAERTQSRVVKDGGSDDVRDAYA